MRKKFTFPQTLIVFVIAPVPLLLGLANFIKMGRAWYYAIHLPTLPLTVPWWYLIASGGFWGLVFTVVMVGLANFHSWGRTGALAAVTFYEAQVWLNHRLFDANDYAHQTWPRDALLALLLLTFIWGSLLHPKIREVFEQ